MTFDDKMSCGYCYDNCIYNYIEAGQVPDFQEYNISAKLGMIYICKIKYSNLLFFSGCQILLIANLIRDLQTIIHQTFVCIEVLNNFILYILPNNRLTSLNFSIV